MKQPWLGLQWEPLWLEREGKPSNITRLGHGAGKSKGKIQQGRKIVSHQEKNNQKHGILTAGSRENREKRNTSKEESKNKGLNEGNC